jgi:hypothetical protein
MAVALIEAFGIFTGATVSFPRMVPILLSLTRVLVLAQQRLKAARIFSWLSAVAILLVAGIGIAKIVIHYTMKVRLDHAQKWISFSNGFRTHSSTPAPSQLKEESMSGYVHFPFL